MPELISIILPVYNAELYVAESIESVLAQDYTHWELLIINDGSTDKSESVITSFDDTRIRYYAQTNRGVSAARNVGLGNMQGAYFCFLDADDRLTPNSLSDRLTVFLANPMVQFVDGKVEIWDQYFNKQFAKWSPRYKGNPLNSLCTLDGKTFFGPTWMIRCQNEVKYRFEEEQTHGEDLLFFIHISCQGGLYDYVQKSSYQYRKGHSSAMSDLKGLAEGYDFIYRQLLGQTGVDKKLAQVFRWKSRLNMLKSFLGRGELFAGLKYFFRR